MAIFGRVAAVILGIPLALIVALYLVLLVTPVPLPFVSGQIRNLVLGSLPKDSQLELGDMALAIEGFAWPVIQFRPVTYTDSKTGGQISMDALEVGFSPVRALFGQPGASITIVGPHLQVNQDIFGPRLAKFEYVDDASGNRTVRIIEGKDAFPQVDFSSSGVDVKGQLPDPNLGIRSDNDWLVYNLEAAAKSIAGIVEQARLGNFSRLVVRNGTLEMNDALYGIFRTFTDIRIDITANGQDGAAGKFSANFGGTVMSGIVERHEQADGSSRMMASITNLDLGAFVPNINDADGMAGLVGPSAVSIDVGVDDKTGGLTDGVFRIDLTGTDLRIGDEYFPVATSIAEVKWNPQEGMFTMGETQVSIGDNRADLSGVFRMGLDPQFGPTISMSMTGRDISIASDLGPPKEPFSEMKFTGWSAPLYGAVGVDQFEISKPDGAQIVSTGRIDMLRAGAGFQMTVAGDKVTADDLKRVWPAFISTQAREWFVKNVTEGRLKTSSMRYNFPVGSIDPRVKDAPLPDGSVSIDIVGEHVAFKPVDSMAPVKIDGEMKLTVRDSNVTIAADGATLKTDKGSLALANLGFVIGSDKPKQTIYEISGDVSGSIPALVDFVTKQQPQALKSGTLPIDLTTLNGDLTLSLVSTIVMDEGKSQPTSLDYAVNGVMQDFSSSAPLQGHVISGGQLSFLASQAGYKVTGQAQIDGIGADVVVDGKPGDGAPPPDILLSAKVDAADMKKFGFDVSQFLSGELNFVARILPDQSVQLALDLEKAGVTIKDLGISKPAGQKGSAKAAIKQDGDTISVSQVDVSFGDVRLKGALTLDAKTGLKTAEFSDFGLSADDSAQLALTPLDDGGIEVRLSGEQLDLKPMFKRFFSLGEGSTGGPQATAVKQTVRVIADLKRAVGFYKTTAYNLNLDLSVRGADLRSASVQANLGNDRSVSVTTNSTPDGRVMSVAFNDLGTLLRLLGVYPNIEDGEGTLVVNTDTKEKVDDGTFVLKNFAFVNEKNVAQVLGNHADSKAAIARSNKLEFKSAKVSFLRRSDRVEIKDALLAGPTVGGTARGFIYIDQRQYDITGTYVPLFGLNNAFQKLLGPLAGRNGEGLFGVTFAIKGPLDDPQFKINPMSALAPGVFRRIFEYRAKEIPRVE